MSGELKRQRSVPMAVEPSESGVRPGSRPFYFKTGRYAPPPPVPSHPPLPPSSLAAPPPPPQFPRTPPPSPPPESYQRCAGRASYFGGRTTPDFRFRVALRSPPPSARAMVLWGRLSAHGPAHPPPLQSHWRAPQPRGRPFWSAPTSTTARAASSTARWRRPPRRWTPASSSARSTRGTCGSSWGQCTAGGLCVRGSAGAGGGGGMQRMPVEVKGTGGGGALRRRWACPPPPGRPKRTPARTSQCWGRQTPAWTRRVHVDAPGQRHGAQPRLRDSRPPE